MPLGKAKTQQIRKNLLSKSRLFPQNKSTDLLLVTSGLPPNSGTLELPSIGASVRLDVAYWAISSSKMPLGSTGLAGPEQEKY